MKDEIELAPSVVVTVKLPLRFDGLIGDHSKKHSQDDAKECDKDIIVNSFHQPVLLRFLPLSEGRFHR